MHNVPRAAPRPITVYWDRSCPMCRTEIEALNLTDYGFVLSDCSAPDFVDTDAAACGITREAMLEALHLQDVDGNWYSGIDAFEIIYRRVGYTHVANWLARKKLRPFHDRLYRLIARNRYWMPRLGLHKPYGQLLRCSQRRRAQKR